MNYCLDILELTKTRISHLAILDKRLMSPGRSENLLALTRIQELEAASRRQRTILEDIQEALNDMNINTANTASRLNVLEAIAKRQREVHHIFYMYKKYKIFISNQRMYFS